jgi:hypothetical protein
VFIVKQKFEVILLYNPRVQLLILEFDGGMILQNNENHSPNDTPSQSRRPESAV